MSLQAGIDEAGRGAVVGPMVLASAETLPQAFHNFQYYDDIKDSKKLSYKKRNIIAKSAINSAIIRTKAISVLPMAIDDNNLNDLTADVCEILIDESIADTIFVDEMPSVPDYDNVRMEQEADDKYKIVGMASIIAKYFRDKAINSISEKENIKLGSGYPSDPETRENLEELVLEDSPTVRYSWSTVY